MNPAHGRPRRSRPLVGDLGDSRYRALADREVIHIRRRHLGLAAIGVIWALMAVAGLFILHPLPALLTWLRSKTWQADACQVVIGTRHPVDTASGAASGGEERFDLVYVYKFGGKGYQTSAWRPGQPDFWAAEAKAPKAQASKLLDRLQNAETCYVNPADPSEAVLERTYPVAAGEELAVLVLIGLLPGVVGIVQGVRER